LFCSVLFVVGSTYAATYQTVSGTPTVIIKDPALDSGGSTLRTSTSYQLRDSLGQSAIGTGDIASPLGTVASQNSGFQNHDTTGPASNIPFTTPATGTSFTPLWEWIAPSDESGIMGYYIRVGTTPGGCDIVPGGSCEAIIANALDYTNDWSWNTAVEVSCDTDTSCSWSQSPALTSVGSYFLTIRTKDLASNIGMYSTSNPYIRIGDCTLDLGQADQLSLGILVTGSDDQMISHNLYIDCNAHDFTIALSDTDLTNSVSTFADVTNVSSGMITTASMASCTDSIGIGCMGVQVTESYADSTFSCDHAYGLASDDKYSGINKLPSPAIPICTGTGSVITDAGESITVKYSAKSFSQATSGDYSDSMIYTLTPNF